jgi:hypothetical protein
LKTPFCKEEKKTEERRDTRHTKLDDFANKNFCDTSQNNSATQRRDEKFHNRIAIQTRTMFLQWRQWHLRAAWCV